MWKDKFHLRPREISSLMFATWLKRSTDKGPGAQSKARIRNYFNRIRIYGLIVILLSALEVISTMAGSDIGSNTMRIILLIESIWNKRLARLLLIINNGLTIVWFVYDRLMEDFLSWCEISAVKIFMCKRLVRFSRSRVCVKIDNFLSSLKVYSFNIYLYLKYII